MSSLKGLLNRRCGFRRICLLAPAVLSVVAVAAACRGAEPDGAGASDGRPTSEKGTARHTNRLARETSPYLLLHAQDPVDWFPWSPEVFEKAKREGKPIFLSIGYSSCHWCHVMHRLVFENEQIARTMNQNFVNVKVDREERPDVDDVYMTAFLVYSQAVGGHEGGGWPLSMFLTPEGKPFAGGTFFPDKDVDGRTGFPSVLARVIDAWRSKRADVEKNADAIAAEVRRMSRLGFELTPVKLDRSLATAAAKALVASSDPEFGGIDFDRRAPNAPKFPAPPKLALLQHEAARAGNEKAAAVLTRTLDQIAAGGIHDHLAGGFHRYSTDRRWHVPHFEKMLYDQAQLAELYAEAYRRNGNRAYRSVAAETFEFVLREMADPSGGFISALDAETGGVEGIYYVWSAGEIDAALGTEDGTLFKRVYGFNEPQVFERGYVLHRVGGLESIARELQITEDDLESRLDRLRKKLLSRRRERPPVLRDDKVITAWNGLMIRALARGGSILHRDEYVEAAEKAARFILTRMRDEHVGLLRTFRADQAKIPAYLEDYAYLADGILTLYGTTHDAKWLRAARGLCDEQIRLFWDEESKGFYSTSRNHEALIARTRNLFDAVLPSANSVSVRNLLRLSAACHESRYRDLARETLEVLAPALAKAPTSMPYSALALEECLDDPEFNASQSDADTLLETAGTGIIQVSDQGSSPRSGSNKQTPIVSASAFLSVDKLPPGAQCRVVIFLKVKEGWHITANPAPESKIATEVSLTAKLGTELKPPNYPKGKMARLPGDDTPSPIYEGKKTAIYSVLTIPEDAAGKTEELTLRIHYQACNDSICNTPADLKLVAKVPVAADRNSVRAANQNLFPKPDK